MSIKIHFYLFVFMSYMFFIGKIEMFMIFYISILLHEIAHIVVALLLKVNVIELNLMPVGISAIYSDKISAKKEVIISMAGPIMSLILAIYSKDLKRTIIYSNIVVAFFNLIPIYPLDGGRIQKNYFIHKYRYKKGIKISQMVSDLFLIILFVLSIILIIYFKNYYLLFLNLYIYNLSKKEMKKERILGIINYLQTDK